MRERRRGGWLCRLSVEIHVAADYPEQAEARLQAFLDDAPQAHRHITGILIPGRGRLCHRDRWQPPTMRQTLRAWFSERQVQDIAKYGLRAGWPHFTTAQDVLDFYRRFEDEVFRVVDDMAEELGVRDVLQALARYTDLEVHRPADWTDGLVRLAVEQVIRQVACDAAEAAPLSA